MEAVCMYDGFRGLFSFGFADVSAAGYFDGLPDDLKAAVERHANEFETPEDMKQFVELLRRRR